MSEVKTRAEQTAVEIQFNKDNVEYFTETFKDGKQMTISIDNNSTLAFNAWAFLTIAKFDEIRIRVATPEELEEWEKMGEKLESEE